MKTTTFPCISRAFARNILQPLLSLLNIQSAPPTIGQNEPQVGGMIVSASIEPFQKASRKEIYGRLFNINYLGFKQLRFRSSLGISRSVARFRDFPIFFLQ
ncbi:hypothetical protein WDW86_20405, partial [Bdellovibrionota bacterium FG-2]